MPRRDIASEVLVALAFIGILAMALTFGIVLTLSRSVAVTVTATAIITPISNQAGTTSQPTGLILSTTLAPTVSLLPTKTNTVTPTPRPPTITRTVQPSVTPRSSASPIQSPSHTPTASLTVSPTAVFTQTVEASATPTVTLVPSNSATPTLTATATASQTLIPLTHAATLPVVPTDTATATPSATETPTPTNTPTATITPTVTVTFTPTATNTLSIPLLPNASPAISGACSNIAARISSPMPGASLTGIIQIDGSASIPNFGFYRLEIRADSSSKSYTIAEARQQVTNGLLAILNTEQFPRGLYWLQLTVVDRQGTIPVIPCAIRVRFGP